MNCKLCGEKFIAIQSLTEHERTENHQKNLMRLSKSKKKPMTIQSSPAADGNLVTSDSIPVLKKEALVASGLLSIADEVPLGSTRLVPETNQDSNNEGSVSFASEAVSDVTEAAVDEAALVASGSLSIVREVPLASMTLDPETNQDSINDGSVSFAAKAVLDVTEAVVNESALVASESHSIVDEVSSGAARLVSETNQDLNNDGSVSFAAEVVSDVAKAVVDESALVASESHSIVDEVSSGAARLVSETDQDLNNDESASFAAEDVSDVAEAIPRTTSKISNIFSCIPCSLGFSNLYDAIQHSKSVTHANMVLVTGIALHDQDNAYVDFTDPFPVLYYCMACNFQSFDEKLYDKHMKSKVHKRIFQHVKNISNEEEEPKALSEQLNPRNGNNHFCKPCSLKFQKSQFYEQHAKSKKHYKVLNFFKRINEGINDIAVDSQFELQSKYFINSLYYCKLCHIFMQPQYYENHLKWKIHKRIEEFMIEMSNIKDRITFDVSDELNNLNKFQKNHTCLHYCDKCSIWCSGFKCYDNHLHGKKHGRKIKQEQNQALENVDNTPTSSYLCESCCIRCSNSKRYKQHLKSKVHVRIEQIMRNKKENSADGAYLGSQDPAEKSVSLLSYCELCDIKCTDSESYNIHLKGKTHKKIKLIVSKISQKI